MCADENGNGVIFKNQFGKGTVYLLAFKDYVKNENEIEIISYLMKFIGQSGNSFCDNINVSFTVREDADKYYLSVLNMNCIEDDIQEFNIAYKSHKISGKIKVGEILEYMLDK